MTTGTLAFAGLLAFSPQTWAIRLQNIDVEALSGATADLLVVDYSRDGGDAGALSPEDVARLKAGPGGRRMVAAYLSVGEAEDYRPYWQKAWKKNPPPWLGPRNPQWRGCRLVRYWDPRWRSIIATGDDSMLVRIVKAGFDGVFLDRMDAFEDWHRREARKPAPRTVNHEAEMASLIVAVSGHARAALARPDFLIVLCNGHVLGHRPEVVAVTSAVAVESFLYEAGKRRTDREVRRTLDALAPFRAAGVPVLAVDYLSRPAARADFERRARALGVVPYAARRALDGP